jgi:hypothetical protein
VVLMVSRRGAHALREERCQNRAAHPDRTAELKQATPLDVVTVSVGSLHGNSPVCWASDWISDRAATRFEQKIPLPAIKLAARNRIVSRALRRQPLD